SSYADLRAGVHINAAIAFARDRAGDVVTNPQRAVAFALTFAQRSQGVSGFTALAERENERVLGRRGIAMAILAGKIDIHRNVRQLLNGVFADSSGVQGGSAAR